MQRVRLENGVEFLLIANALVHPRWQTTTTGSHISVNATWWCWYDVVRWDAIWKKWGAVFKAPSPRFLRQREMYYASEVSKYYLYVTFNCKVPIRGLNRAPLKLTYILLSQSTPLPSRTITAHTPTTTNAPQQAHVPKLQFLDTTPSLGEILFNQSMGTPMTRESAQPTPTKCDS